MSPLRIQARAWAHYIPRRIADALLISDITQTRTVIALVNIIAGIVLGSIDYDVHTHYRNLNQMLNLNIWATVASIVGWLGLLNVFFQIDNLQSRVAESYGSLVLWTIFLLGGIGSATDLPIAYIMPGFSLWIVIRMDSDQ